MSEITPQAINVVDEARHAVIGHILKTGTVEKAWPVWRDRIREIIGQHPTVDSILDIDQHLASIFQPTGAKGRDQGTLSGGGTAWECLVGWVINLWLCHSHAIVYKKRSDVPEPIRKALTVTYGAVTANTEADLVAVSYPSDEPLIWQPLSKEESAFERLEDIAKKRFNDIAVAVIQTKTNWNDNAQIPMLWDMIYHAKGFDVNVSVGSGAWDLKRLRSFRYAFVVVPSNDREKIYPHSTCVLRVARLSGGNYWGWPSRNGVAANLRDIFKRTAIGPYGGAGVRDTLAKAVDHLGDRYSYFDITPE